MRLLPSFFLLVALSCPFAAQACSCSYPPQGTTEAQAFERQWQWTQSIVEADFISVTITLLPHGDPVEEGVLRVRKSFKGQFKPGDLIRTKTNTSGAACGLSLRGSPPAALLPSIKSGKEDWEWGRYDRWILFLAGGAPFQVGSCSSSAPSALFTESDLLRLQQRQARAGKQGKQ